MGKKKYIKNSNGVTMSVTTDILGLEKPLLNENYDIDVHNRNMDKIDEDLTPIDDSYIIELFQHDGDTTNPRDYYTKAEADGKFASKEEANNALNKANEAFQRGDNVKSQLVDRLISEGLEVSTNNTFEELIGGIALGKKWATGTTIPPLTGKDFTMGNGLTRSTSYVEIPKLDFTPSLIVVTSCSGTNPNYASVLSTTDTQLFKPNIIMGYFPSAYNSATSGGTWKVDSNVLVDGKYHIPAASGLNTTWLAYE